MHTSCATNNPIYPQDEIARERKLDISKREKAFIPLKFPTKTKVSSKKESSQKYDT